MPRIVCLTQVHDRQHHENKSLQRDDQDVENGPAELQEAAVRGDEARTLELIERLQTHVGTIVPDELPDLGPLDDAIDPAVAADVLDGYLARRLGLTTDLGKVIDPLVEDLCREEAHFARVPPRDWPQEAIIETLFLTQLLALARVRAAVPVQIIEHVGDFPDEFSVALARHRAVDVFNLIPCQTGSLHRAQRLIHLVTDLLELSTVEGRRVPLALAEVDVGALAERLLEDYYERGWTDGLPIVAPTPLSSSTQGIRFSWRPVTSSSVGVM